MGEARQHIPTHHPGGWRRFYDWRRYPYEVWLVVTRRYSLHRAWQAGYDQGHADEVFRQLRVSGWKPANDNPEEARLDSAAPGA